ncbi:tRNA (adenosine(37)-N6)-dimethylallyltransferase MiaA [Saccharicrinis sp. FJH54]|uniref:tRNA (adenosine(37)-N6)-dimethylallyltransferase MiaA n=1 Tax=Saccharicrinis sp. FJH54 TaxID=3344665 RepID=UPI0035D40276
MPVKHLIVLVGPTAVGKTKVSLELAQTFGCEIISADSRQFYKYMKIGTAAPTANELQTAKHHFVHFLEPDRYYNASTFEHQVLELLENIFQPNDTAILCGGSMLYADAVVKGIDLMPDVDPEIRKNLYEAHKNGEIDALRLQLKQLDPAYYNEADLKNPVRIIHALEVCLTTGKPFSEFRTKQQKDRPFNVIKIGLNIPREDLFERINIRVEQMIAEGLVEEVKELAHYKGENALNTVGYREIFEYLDGKISLERAIELIQRNTRRYAKKQLTWFKKDPDTVWFSPEDTSIIIEHIRQKILNY